MFRHIEPLVKPLDTVRTGQIRSDDLDLIGQPIPIRIGQTQHAPAILVGDIEQPIRPKGHQTRFTEPFGKETHRKASRHTKPFTCGVGGRHNSRGISYRCRGGGRPSRSNGGCWDQHRATVRDNGRRGYRRCRDLGRRGRHRHGQGRRECGGWCCHWRNRCHGGNGRRRGLRLVGTWQARQATAGQ